MTGNQAEENIIASTYSTNLALELIGTGEQSGTWGTTTNTNLGTLLEQAISGYTTQAMADANQTITIPNGATGVARNMFIECTGALTAARQLIVPANKKLYYVYNNTTGGYAITVLVSGQTGVSVANGKKMTLVNNGTDIVSAVDYFISPTFVTPALGTPASGNLANCTGIPTPTAITVANEATDTTCFPAFFTAATGDLGPKSNAVLTFNSATGLLAATRVDAAALNGTLGATTPATVAATTLTSTQASSFATSSGNVGVGTASPDLVGSGASKIVGVRGAASANSIAELQLVGDQTTGTNITGRIIFGHLPAGYTSEIYGFRDGADSSQGIKFRTFSAGVAADRMTLSSGGGVSVSTGMAVGGATAGAGGIAFPATAVAVTDANTLDDYEEGTWTPVLGGAGGTSGQTYGGATSGRYTKVGRVVNLQCYILLSTKGTITGQLQIQGLPFAISGKFNSGISYWYATATAITGIAFDVGSGTVLPLYAWASATTSIFAITLATADIVNGFEIGFSTSYTT